MPQRPAMALLLLLTSLLLAPAATALPSPQWSPRLPTDMSQWAYTPDWAAHQHLRVWDLPTLQHASKEAGFLQMRSLLDKLHGGRPISVAAFGDSITANHGGCFGGADDGSGDLDPRRKQQDACTVGSHGILMPWLETFMHMINATWPHPGHRAVNLGLPGSSFQTYAEGVCIEQSLPSQVDLVILEHLPYLEAPGGTIREAERLLHRLWLHLELPLPAVVFLNMHLALEGESGEPTHVCIQQALQCNECPTSFTNLPKPESLALEAEVHTHMLAKYYGMASLSYVSAIHAMLMAETPKRLGMTKCQFFSSLYLDRVHPRNSGRLLITDLLVNYLVHAEQHLVNLDRGEAGGGHPRPTHALTLQPMDPASNQVYRMRCYYSAPAPDAGAGAAAAAAVVGPMRIARAEGWEFVERDGESQKYKPGWVASAPGAVLWVELDPNLPNIGQHHVRALQQLWLSPEQQPGQEPGAGTVEVPAVTSPAAPAPAAHGHSIAAGVGDRVFIMLTFLRSYRHMGKAQVSCLKACSCGSVVLDGHEPNFPHSIPELTIVGATVTAATGRCLLQVEVLPGSSSGEHKFKVAHVALGNLRDMTEPLRIVAKRVEQLNRQVQQVSP